MASGNYLIVGGSGGIGRAVCAKLETLGHRAIATYSMNKPNMPHSLKLDLSKNKDIDFCLSKLADIYPELDGIVLLSSPPPVLAMFGRISEEDMQHQLQVNVIAIQKLISGVVRLFFRQRKSGVIVGVLSKAMGDSHRAAMKNMGAYTISKYGLLGVLKLLDADYSWLRVETVSPDFTETAMLNAFDDRFLDQMRKHKPFSNAEDIADEILEKLISSS